MKTDWDLLRSMIGAALDACERIETSGYDERDRDAVVELDGRQVSVHDFLVSAWTLPENLRYQVIRMRHDAGDDLAYVPETARILIAMAQAAAELIGAGDDAAVSAEMRRIVGWYRDHAMPGIEKAIHDRRRGAA